MLTPEFVMPPEAVEPPAPLAAATTSGEQSTEVADPTADRDDVVLARERPPWRQLLIAVLVGVLLGSTVPAVLREADRSAADARVESLRSVAQRYLAAIAEGDAELATAMVPTGDEAGAADVLRSADPITGAEAHFVVVEGEAGSVEVRYQVGAVREQRTLDAERADGGWRLTTSLAEPVVVHAPDGAAGASVGGVELPSSRAVMLYPGRYQVDRIVGPLLRSGGEHFEVDGDPESPTELFTDLQPSEQLGDAALAVAASRVESCRALPECPVGEHTVVAIPPVAPQILRIDPGAIDLAVLLGLDAADGGRWQELQLRAILGEGGSLASWECGEVDVPHSDLEPCSP